jgi:hypothetical protein
MEMNTDRVTTATNWLLKANGRLEINLLAIEEADH